MAAAMYSLSRQLMFPCVVPHMLLITIILLLTIPCNSSEAYFANWGDIGRAQEPTCVDIPKNMSLCSNIEYERMRLPNLLAHDTLTEVAHQSSSWVPLLNVRCHPDTQLFLCSLFTPVCLERPIYPCRSLCERVQKACEHRMTTYGYHWPDMLRCDNFPEDNDMCLKGVHSAAATAQHEQTESPDTAIASTGDSGCPVCEPVPTYENILDHYCRADFVIRIRVKTLRDQRIIARKARIYKPALSGSRNEDQSLVRGQRRLLRKPTLFLEQDSDCCFGKLSGASGATRYLVMGKNTTQGLVPTFVLPWTRQKSIRDAVRVFTGLDCSDPSLFTPDTQSGAILNTVGASNGGGNRRRGRDRAGKKRKGRNGAAANGGGRRGRGRKREEGKRSGRRNGGGGGRRNGGGENSVVSKKRGSTGNEENGAVTNERRKDRRNRRKKNEKKDARKKPRNRNRIDKEEKQRRKEFIRRKIEQSTFENNIVDDPIIVS